MVWEVLVCCVQQEKKGKTLTKQQLLHAESEGVYPGYCTSSAAALPGPLHASSELICDA